jgi:hypothetical protein
LGLVQLKKVLWILLMMITIAPMGIAIEFGQDPVTSTESSLEIVLNGDYQPDIATTDPSAIGWDYLISTMDMQDKNSAKYSKLNIDDIFEAISDALPSQDSESIQKRESLNYMTPRDSLSSDRIDSDYLNDQIIRIASTDSKFHSNTKYFYLKENEGRALKTKIDCLGQNINSNMNSICLEEESANDVIADQGIPALETPSSDPYNQYYYETNIKKDTSTPILSAAHDIDLDFDYIHMDNNNYGSQNYKLSNSKSSDILGVETRTNENLKNLIRDNIEALSKPDFSSIDELDMQMIENASFLDKKSSTVKNYAVVIGINNYSDRSSLHTSINDAKTMAALLESYGYDVFELTDIADDKPTKGNILGKALGEIKYKRDLGKVVIYFSGHGEKMGNNYYLIPQDSNGQISSYISTQELEKSIAGLKNTDVAMIVDACYSGGLENVVDDGQMILVSSKEDQPSNEMWFGSLSLFTYNLCEAMREEDRSSSSIFLERCFYKARESTERWSSWHYLAQTPQMKDKTSGYFSLK